MNIEASWTLASVAVPSGPGEIHELADSFNLMVEALAASRAETEEHIASLEKTNSALAQAREQVAAALGVPQEQVRVRVRIDPV